MANTNINCQPWKTRYLYRQKQVNAYAKKVMPEYMASVVQKTAATDNRCVACGEIIPEGRLVCPNCEKKG